ncbi:conserved hypothetical protein [Talaromyces stipitatus ATCC 10500]|uniref:Uncharacterized protein n=1 Tax=Talaromyces stipitatus (strain ATCC 10500 / CBS 375.48 / QM 6759 / NRRL 1006) TaxID=441959 RepID=B8MT45_TALSN|nr:uncharacterized protein TSTA_003110 [Talaromyces stipitatus ATCC 10500]EED12248.1 conserved hypothetical protein [Talaromyces stipitatus ATCC 10500]
MMQLAEVLSDLTSLRACGHHEALVLVNVHKATVAKTSTEEDDTKRDAEQHTDLSRAKELMELHYGVKVKHMGNAPNYEPVIDEGLRRAREDVNRVLRELDV